MTAGNQHKSQSDIVIPRRLLTVGLVLAVAIVAWLMVRPASTATPTANLSATESASASSPLTMPVAPVIVSVEELKAQTNTLGIPVYWNGEMKGTNIELTILRDATVFVRYLPKGVSAGDKAPYFTVATYMNQNAYAQVQSLAAAPGAKSIKYSGGALAATASETDPNTYFAYEGVPALIDVFSQNPPEGWDLIASGSIRLLN